MSDGVDIPNIATVNYKTYQLIRQSQTEEERNKEDLNDKKCAWLYVALKKGFDNLNERDKKFAEQYQKENLRYSLHYIYKEWLFQFIEQQKVKYGLK